MALNIMNFQILNEMTKVLTKEEKAEKKLQREKDKLLHINIRCRHYKAFIDSLDERQKAFFLKYIGYEHRRYKGEHLLTFMETDFKINNQCYPFDDRIYKSPIF